MTNSTSTRSKFEGVKRIVQFNWTIYAMAIFGIPFLLSASAIFGRSAHIIAMGLSVITLCVIFASLIVSHWIYDRSSLYTFDWLQDLVGSPERICNLHAGYNEIEDMLAKQFPTAAISSVNFFNAIQQPETSLMVARRLYPEQCASINSDLTSSPVEANSVDLAVVCFAAHELRQSKERELLFRELTRMLKPDGKAVIVEHLRDWRNFAVFGPGALHFFSPDTWTDETQNSGLSVEKFFRITPFVGIFVVHQSDSQAQGMNQSP